MALARPSRPMMTVGVAAMNVDDTAARRGSGADARAAPASVDHSGRWQLRLLGGLQLHGPDRDLARLPSRAATALLARLALAPDRDHPREELIELLWPGVDAAVGRNRLRQTLSTLKALLEPPGQPPVIVATRLALRLVPGAVGCDAVQFESMLRQGDAATAARLYRGELLPGLFDDWIHAERLRLSALADRLEVHPGERTADAAVRPAPPGPPPVATPAVAPPPPAFSPHALPVYLTRYFGTESQATRLRRLVTSQRLVTLVGPGGIGKTRLAVELARALRDTPDLGGDEPGLPRFDQVAFVPLAGCCDLDAMLDALARAFGLTVPVDQVLARLGTMLGGLRLLLVLDNLEQLLPDAAAEVARLLALTPTLHVLVTSRRVLDVDGEQVCSLDPLPPPPADAALDELAASPAVALFIDRARASRADFHLGARNATPLAELVTVMGGLPLAIELAASRVRSLGLADMRQRLQPDASVPAGAALAMLSRPGPRSGHDPRHASMERVIGWSWDLLPAAVQSLLERLTVFVAGFTPATAAMVAPPDLDVLDALDEAVRHSLLAATGLPDGSTRLQMSESVREFARARLGAADAAEVRQRFRAGWQRWARALPPTPPLAEVRRESPNLVAALASANADGVPDDGVRLMLTLRPALDEVALSGSGLLQLQHAVQACRDPALRGPGWSLLAAMAFDGGMRDQARQWAAQSLDETPPGHPGRARSLQIAGHIAWTSQRDRTRVQHLIEEAEPLARAAGDDAVLASLLGLRAYALHVSVGDTAGARALFEQVEPLRQRAGNRHALHNAWYHQANIALQAGDLLRAVDGFERVCRAARADDDAFQLSMAADAWGNALIQRRDWTGALARYVDAAESAWQASDLYNWCYALWNVPSALVRLHQPGPAQRLMVFAATFWQRRYGELTAADRRHMARIDRLVRSLAGRASAQAWADAAADLGPADAMREFRQAAAQATAQATAPRKAG